MVSELNPFSGVCTYFEGTQDRCDERPQLEIHYIIDG